MLKLIRISLVMSNTKRANLIRKMKLIKSIGKNCSVARNIFFGSEPELISLGNNVWLTRGVRLLTHDGSIHMLSKGLKKKLNPKLGRITIHDNSFIGTDSIILPGVTIGPNAIVGAGSVVTKSVPKNTIVAGNPAKQITTIDEFIAKNESVNSTELLDSINHTRKKMLLKLCSGK